MEEPKTRYRTRFLLFPKKIGNERRYFGRVHWIEEWAPDEYKSLEAWADIWSWRPVRFVERPKQ